jgi:hypothetical protein
MGAIVFTQSIDEAGAGEFERLYEQICKYANKKGLKKPKKGELLVWIIKQAGKEFNPEGYFAGK